MSTVKDEIQRISRSQSETVGELAKWSDLIDKIGAILAIVEAVLALILGGVLGKIPASVGYYYEPSFNFGTFFLVLVLGAINVVITFAVCRVLSIVLRQKGLALRNAEQTCSLMKLMISLEHQEEEQPVKTEKKPASVPTPPQTQEEKSEEKQEGDAVEAIPVPTELTGVIRCPKCGTKQKSDRDSCCYCRIKFKKI